jgi:hypothetical protein
MFTQFNNTLLGDNFRLTRIALVITLVLLMAWALWFFTSPLPDYVVSSTVTVTERPETLLIAQFPAGYAFEVGQMAVLQGTSIEATITRVETNADGGVTVTLKPSTSGSLATPITVGVVVGTKSAAQLLLTLMNQRTN